MQIWSSIEDLPIYNYWKVIETGVLDYLLIEKPEKIEKSVKKKLLEAWDNIQTEMLDLQIKDKSFVEHLQAEKRHYLKKIKAALTQKTYDVLVYEASEEARKKEINEPFDFENSLAMLEEKLHYQIDDKKMTVKRYYIHLIRLKNGK